MDIFAWKTFSKLSCIINTGVKKIRFKKKEIECNFQPCWFLYETIFHSTFLFFKGTNLTPLSQDLQKYLTPLSQTPRCHWHHGVAFEGTIREKNWWRNIEIQCNIIRSAYEPLWWILSELKVISASSCIIYVNDQC